ncbi:GNAT family N-acetyltransferase [Massilia aurea]|uniref:GNAT family N-acetyltransferase n=1 Tax=Massilia aurea TaxID=373040 RepID=UPI003461AA37
MPVTTRLLLPSDLDAVLRIQAACYPPAMQEPAAIVLSRMAAACGTCLAGCDDDGLCGYLFAYPSRLGLVTDLGAPFSPAQDADTLYLHDLALDPRAQGRGIARALMAEALCLAGTMGLGHSALVSVQDSTRFWHALGYRITSTRDAGLHTYPPGAVYMVRTPA